MKPNVKIMQTSDLSITRDLELLKEFQAILNNVSQYKLLNKVKQGLDQANLHLYFMDKCKFTGKFDAYLSRKGSAYDDRIKFYGIEEKSIQGLIAAVEKEIPRYAKRSDVTVSEYELERSVEKMFSREELTVEEFNEYKRLIVEQLQLKIAEVQALDTKDFQT